MDDRLVYDFDDLPIRVQEKLYRDWAKEAIFDDEEFRKANSILTDKMLSRIYRGGHHFEILHMSGVRLYKFLLNNFWNLLFYEKPVLRVWHGMHFKRKVFKSKIFKKEDYSNANDFLLAFSAPFMLFIEHPSDDIMFKDLIDRGLKAMKSELDYQALHFYSFSNFADAEALYDKEYFADGTVAKGGWRYKAYKESPSPLYGMG